MDWRLRTPYEVLYAVAHAGTQPLLPVGPPEQPCRDVQLLIELRGVPVEQRQAVCDQLMSPEHPLGRVAHMVSRRHFDSDNAALLVYCRPAAELEEAGVDVVTEAARWRSGEGLVVEVEGAGAGRPYRVRLPVRGVPSERPPGHATVKIIGLTPTYARTGLTEILLGCAGYQVEGDVVPRVASEHVAHCKSSKGVGNAAVVIAWVACPPNDPTLRLMPRSFSTGSLPAKIEVIPAQESIGPTGAAWAFAPRGGVHPMEEFTGVGLGSAPRGLGRGHGVRGRDPPARPNAAAAGGTGPSRAGMEAGGREVPMHAGPQGPPGGPAGPSQAGAEPPSSDIEMEDAEGTRGVFTSHEREAWCHTRAGQLWAGAIARATAGEYVEGLMADAAVLEAFFGRYAGGLEGVNLWEWGEGQCLPVSVRAWLRLAGYSQSYGDDSDGSSSGTGSDDEEGAVSDRGTDTGPTLRRSVRRRQQQQDAAPGSSGPASSGQQSPGAGQAAGRSEAPGAAAEASPPAGREPATGGIFVRRSARERRQAPLPSDLPGSLAPSSRPSGGDSPASDAVGCPPRPGSGEGGRHS